MPNTEDSCTFPDFERETRRPSVRSRHLREATQPEEIVETGDVVLDIAGGARARCRRGGPSDCNGSGGGRLRMGWCYTTDDSLRPGSDCCPDNIPAATSGVFPGNQTRQSLPADAVDPWRQIRRPPNKTDSRNQWIAEKQRKLGMAKTCVAVANKNARTIRALLARDEPYRRAAYVQSDKFLRDWEDGIDGVNGETGLSKTCQQGAEPMRRAMTCLRKISADSIMAPSATTLNCEAGICRQWFLTPSLR